MRIDLSQPHVLQVNVGRSWAAHEAALQLAFEQHCLAVLIQEPWIFHDCSRRLSKHHPAYSQFSPIEDWSNRPRVLTYILKHPLLSATQVPLGPPIRDLLAVSIATDQHPTILLVNVYNAPAGCLDEHQGVDHLRHISIPHPPCLIAGDFNLRHPSWETAGPVSPRAAPFLEWAEAQGLSLTLAPDTRTHGSSMIDLAWANPALSALGITSEVPEDFPPLADHEAISSTFYWGTRKHCRPSPPLRWNTLDEPLFLQALQRESAMVYQAADALPQPSTPAQLDSLSTVITGAIMTAVEASTHRAYPRPNGHCWWNPECSAAVRTLRQVSRSSLSSEEDRKHTSKAFKQTVR